MGEALRAVVYWFTALAVVFAIGALSFPLMGNVDDMVMPGTLGTTVFHWDAR